VEFEEEFGKFDQCVIDLQSGPELKDAYALFRHGEVMQLSMGYSNEIIQPMFVGFYQKIKPNFSERTLRLTFAQYLKAMDMTERERVLTGKTLGQVIRSIISNYSPIVVGNIENKDVIISDTISQSKRTDFKLLEEIASSFAMKFFVEPTDVVGQWALSMERLDTEQPPIGKPMYAWPSKDAQDLTQNIHLVNFSPESNILGGVSSQITIESNNPNKPIEVNSKKFSPEKYVTQTRGSEIVYRVFGQVRRVHFYENVSDEEAAQIIADQMLQDEELAFVTAKNTQLSEGDCLVRAGQRRKVHPRGIPLFEAVFDGVYTITRTKHVIDVDKGYDTWVDMGRESLSLPPPPELPPAGSGYGMGNGQPVIVYVYEDGTFEAYYVSFVEGGYVLGNRIPNEEFLANEHYMAHVRDRGYGGGFVPFTSYTAYSPNGPSGIMTQGAYDGVPKSENLDTFPGGAYTLPSVVGYNENKERFEIKIDWGRYESLELGVRVDIPPGGMSDEEISDMVQNSEVVRRNQARQELRDFFGGLGEAAEATAEQEEAARQQALSEGNIDEYLSYYD
jgi:hypothetical protein